MSAAAIRRLSKLFAGCRERAYADEWTGFEDEGTARIESRTLLFAASLGVTGPVIERANRLIDFGQLELPLS